MKIRLNQGFHGGSGGGNLNGWGTWWKAINDAGYPVNAIMADTAGPLSEIQNQSNRQDNVLVYRISLWRDTNGDGVADFDPNTPNYKANPETEAERMVLTKRNMFWPSELDKSKVWLKDTNEIRTKISCVDDNFWNMLSPGEWWGRYALKAAQITVQRNEKIILLSPSSGDHTMAFWDQPSMIQFLEYAVEHSDHVAIGLHEYSYDKNNILHPFIGVTDYLNSQPGDRKIGRFELLFDVCDSYGIGWPKLYFCEWGWEERNIPPVARALADLRLVTQNVYGAYYKYILGFGTWYLGPGFGDIHNQTNGILLPSAKITVSEEFEVEERKPIIDNNPGDCPALTDVRTTALWIPQYNLLTDEELEQVISWAKDGFTLPNGKTSGGHMLCPSHIDALRIHTQGLPGSILGIAYPEKIGSGVTTAWLEENCPCVFQDKTVVFLGGNTSENPFSRLAIPVYRISQLWGENPANYIEFGLPGHEGIDTPVPVGTPVYATVKGVVSSITTTGNYGNCVRVRTTLNDTTYELIFAHLSEFRVSVGTWVVPDTVIGLSGNTGNSSGPHLHFSVKVLNRTYTDSYGTWPSNLHNPMLWLDELYANEITGISGYLYLSSVRIDDTSNIAYAKGALNLRAMPTSTSALLGVVPSGDILQVISPSPVNGYVYCKTRLAPPIATATDYGLHMRADPNLPSQAEFTAVQRLIASGGKTVKVLHNHPAGVYTAIRSYNPNYVIIRIMQAWGGRNVSPQDFYNWTIYDLVNRVSILGNIPILVEVHNEPNLVEEGWTLSWQNGAEFAEWFNSVVALYKARSELANVKFVFPGLSPGGNSPNQRYDSTAFLNEAINRGLVADSFACHAYWSSIYPISQALQDVQNVKNRIGSKKLYVTEVSRNDRPSVISEAQRGAEYADFIRRVNADAVYFFVASASNPFFEPETWITETGIDKGITSSLIQNL